MSIDQVEVKARSWTSALFVLNFFIGGKKILDDTYAPSLVRKAFRVRSIVHVILIITGIFILSTGIYQLLVIFLFPYLLKLKYFRSYLFLSSSIVRFRNYTFTNTVPSTEISEIKIVIYTEGGYSRPPEGNSSDHITFQDFNEEGRSFYFTGHHETLLQEIGNFAEWNNISIKREFRKGPDPSAE